MSVPFPDIISALSLTYSFAINKGGKFLKKLRCRVGRKYLKIIWFYQPDLECELSTVKRFESFRVSLRWPIHIINPVDKTKLSYSLAQSRVIFAAWVCPDPPRRMCDRSSLSSPCFKRNGEISLTVAFAMFIDMLCKICHCENIILDHRKAPLF